MRRIFNKRSYERLIFYFTGSILLLAIGKIISYSIPFELPTCLLLIIAILEFVFAGLIFVLGFLVSPVEFIHKFKTYCLVLENALKKIQNTCEIYTIQTPILIQSDTQKAYEKYLKATVKALIKLDADDSHIVTLYRRLVVVNSPDNKEKDNEKFKLETFINVLFSQISTSSDIYKGNLQNIKILITKWENIIKTPYLNMDVFIIDENFLNLAIPIYHNQTKIYEWGTSINIQKNSLLQGYKYEVERFKQIYEDAWDAAIAANNGSSLIEFKFDNGKSIASLQKEVMDKIDDIFQTINQ